LHTDNQFRLQFARKRSEYRNVSRPATLRRRGGMHPILPDLPLFLDEGNALKLAYVLLTTVSRSPFLKSKSSSCLLSKSYSARTTICAKHSKTQPLNLYCVFVLTGYRYHWREGATKTLCYDRQGKTRNSSGDEIANVNFLYDDTEHSPYVIYR